MATNNATNTSKPVLVSQGGTGNASLTAYAVVTGGTTSTGALQSVSGVGTSGQILISAGASALPAWGTAPAGSWILLNTQTASNSASLTFTSTYITSTYVSYVVIIRGINNATGTTTLSMNWSTNNGSSYLSSLFKTGIIYNTYNSGTLANAISTTNCVLTPSISSTNISLNGILYLNFNTSAIAAYNGQIFNPDATTKNIVCYGVNTGTTTINNISFSYSSGNITSGTLSLYGIAQ